MKFVNISVRGGGGGKLEKAKLMASPADNQFVMGYPTTKQNQEEPPPAPGYAMPYHPGAYPPHPPPPQPGYHGYMGPTASKTHYNMWHRSKSYGPMGWGGPDDDNKGKKFGRVMLVTMVTLIVSMCMVSLVIWFLFGMEIPEFHASAMSVSNLSVNNTWIEGNWDGNVTVFNPNSDVTISFEPIRASIFYKNYPLGMSSVEPFYVQGLRLHNLPINLDNQRALSKPLLSEQMNEDRHKGFIYVSLRVSLGTKFSSSSIWRKETLRVFCEDLKINLAPEGGAGTLAEDAQTECLLFT